MFRTSWFRSLAPLALALMLAAWPAFGQEPAAPQKTFTEKFKAKAGSAVESIKKGAASASETVREQYARARTEVTRMGIEARVYARLHWEKALETSKVDLSSPRLGVIALNGSVTDEKARAKAIELTRDTIGVNQVVDNLTVRTVTSPGAAPR